MVTLTLTTIHILSVIAWMVGLLYLPRLLSYHSDVAVGSESDQLFITMERRLLQIITTPAMLVAVISGMILAVYTYYYYSPWLHLKFLFVVLLIIFHFLVAHWVKQFRRQQRPRSKRFFRIINEVPTVLLIIIVGLVVFKPYLPW